MILNFLREVSTEICNKLADVGSGNLSTLAFQVSLIEVFFDETGGETPLLKYIKKGCKNYIQSFFYMYDYDIWVLHCL